MTANKNEFSGIEITEIEAKSKELIAVKSGWQNHLNHRTPNELVHEIRSLIAQILNKSIKWGSTTWLKKAKYGVYTWKERGKKVILVAQTHQSSTDSTQILTKEWKTKQIKCITEDWSYHTSPKCIFSISFPQKMWMQFVWILMNCLAKYFIG